MIFLGIDPGLRKTGVGIIYGDNTVTKYVGHRLIKTDSSAPLPERLGTLIEGLSECIDEFKPDFAAIEDIFYSENVKSALLLGQARGALISTAVFKKLPVIEFTALQIKKAVTGYGKADKEQVKKLVELQLNILVKKNVPLDVTDALACSLCLAYHKTRGISFDI